MAFRELTSSEMRKNVIAILGVLLFVGINIGISLLWTYSEYSNSHYGFPEGGLANFIGAFFTLFFLTGAVLSIGAQISRRQANKG